MSLRVYVGRICKEESFWVFLREGLVWARGSWFLEFCLFLLIFEFLRRFWFFFYIIVKRFLVDVVLNIVFMDFRSRDKKGVLEKEGWYCFFIGGYIFLRF